MSRFKDGTLLPRQNDFSNARLKQLMAAVIAAICTWFLLRQWLPEAWRVPGSPQLYLTGVAGVLLLLVPAAFAFVKRSARTDNPRGWFNAHVVCSSLGAILIAVHSGGFLRRPPALLLLAIVALAGLGVWARTRGARRMAATFASKAPAFKAPGGATRERLRAIIGEKQRLLAQLDGDAREGVFSVTLAHLISAPRLALAYRKLEREESRLLGTRAAAGSAQAWWRPLHMALAWLFVAGVLVHVITVTFFAGYVADGGEITWWHLAEW